MGQAQFSMSLQGGGVAIQQNVVVSADHPNPFDPDIPAGIAGELTTRTDNDTGVVTVASGHGVVDTDTVDLYTSAGVLIRKDMDVTAVTSTTISIDAGTGSNLPTVNDPVVISEQKTVNTSIDGDAIQILGLCLEIAGATGNGRVLFEDAAGDDIADISLTANLPLVYNVAAGQTNPLTGDPITVARVSNGNTTAGKLKIISMEDSTP